MAVDGAGAPMAFLPLERDADRPRLGHPSGRWLTDYQGLVAAPDTSVDVLEMVREAGLDTWRFDHVPVDQRAFSPWSRSTDPSPQIDLRGGFDAYAAATPIVRDAANARRRMERDLGPVRVDAHTDARAVFDALLTWKSAQYRRTGARDIFAIDWCRAAVTRLASADGPSFAGRLSALWAGDQLVAAHLGLRSYGRWHWFLPAYDPAYSRYSPGTVLIVELARRAAELDIAVIDLGKGAEPYKARLGNAAVMVAAGSVEVRSPARTVRRMAARVSPRRPR